MGSRFDADDGVLIEEKSGTRSRRPRMWRVLLHNDDYTTRDFVVEVLMTVFRKDERTAVTIMMNVHTKGVGVAGIYTKEIGETKVKTVEMLAKQNEYPLRLSMEPEG